MDTMEYIAKFVGFTTIIVVTLFVLWLLFWICVFAIDWLEDLWWDITCWWEDRKNKKNKEKEENEDTN